MKQVLILCMFLFIGESMALAEFTSFPPLPSIGTTNSIQNNTMANYSNPFVNSNNFNLNAVNKIEQTLFGHIYIKQNISLRLSRIEKSLFNSTYPDASITERLDNIISNFNQLNKYPNISKNSLSKIEAKVFSQCFPQNNIDRRIERLEQQIFGAVQSGDLNSRYNNVLAASKNYNTNAVDQYYKSPMVSTGWKGMLGGLKNSMLSGNMTGFTPPINQYGNNYGYNDPYTSLGPDSGSGIYRGYRANNGFGGYSYHDNFSNYGSGTGVTILD